MSSLPAGLGRDFRYFWSAHTISQFGSQITLLALPLTAATLLKADPGDMGLLGMAGTLPFLFFGLIAGVIVDRIRKRSLMIGMDLVRAVLIALVPVFAWGGWLNLLQLYVIAFMAATASLFFDVAYQAYVPSIVAPSQIVKANGQLEASTSVATVAGPGLTGILTRFLGAPIALALDAASFLLSAMALGKIRKAEPPLASRQWTIGSDIQEGLSFVWRQKLVLALTSCTAIWFVGWQIFSVNYILAVKEVFHLNDADLGLTLAAQGGGALLASVLAGRAAAVVGVGRALTGGAAICAAGGAVIAMTGDFLPFVFLCLGQMLIGFGSTLYYVNHVSLRQSVTPSGLMGRVNATVRFLTWGIQPFAALLGGWIGETWSLRTSLGVTAALFALALTPLFLAKNLFRPAELRRIIETI